MQTRLILISGPPGSGKSTLAQGMARRLSNSVLLDKDCIDEPFSPDDRGVHYTEEIEPRVIRALLNLAVLNLQLGKDVLIDLPWTHVLLNSPEWISRLHECVQTSHAQLRVLECVLSAQTLRARIAQRGLKRDAVKLSAEGWLQFCQTDRIGEVNPLPHHCLDAEMAPDVLLRQALGNL